MKKTLLGIGVIGGIIILGIGLTKLIKEQVRLLLSYCYRIKNVRLKSFKKDGVEMTIDFALKNQSDITLEITDFNIDVYLEGVKVTTIKKPSMDIVWKAKEVSVIPIDVVFNPQDVFKSSQLTDLIVKASYNYSKLNIRTVGTVSAKHSFLSAKNFPLDLSMTIAEAMSDDPKLEKCTI